jgi:hypothetical protein
MGEDIHEVYVYVLKRKWHIKYINNGFELEHTHTDCYRYDKIYNWVRQND